MVKRYRKPPSKRSRTVHRVIAATAAAEMDQPAATELQTMWKSRKLWTSILLFVLLFITPGKPYDNLTITCLWCDIVVIIKKCKFHNTFIRLFLPIKKHGPKILILFFGHLRTKMKHNSYFPNLDSRK
ncbi:hypothetical protein QTP88_007541 [Uroleucon formosanum]